MIFPQQAVLLMKCFYDISLAEVYDMTLKQQDDFLIAECQFLSTVTMTEKVSRLWRFLVVTVFLVWCFVRSFNIWGWPAMNSQTWLRLWESRSVLPERAPHTAVSSRKRITSSLLRAWNANGITALDFKTVVAGFEISTTIVSVSATETVYETENTFHSLTELVMVPVMLRQNVQEKSWKDTECGRGGCNTVAPTAVIHRSCAIRSNSGTYMEVEVDVSWTRLVCIKLLMRWSYTCPNVALKLKYTLTRRLSCAILMRRTSKRLVKN